MPRYTPEDNVVGNTIVNGVLDTNGGVQRAVTAVSAAYTVLLTDEVVLVTTGGAAKVITLPTPVGNIGRTFTIKKVDSAAFSATVTPAAGTVDGAGTFALTAQFKYVTVVSDGTNYVVVANN